MLTLTFLGTSAGVPTKARNVTGLAVAFNNPHSRQRHRPWLLVDCGEGTQHQLLHTPLSLQQLRVICITHVHGDHCYGLPGLLASMSMHGRTAPLTLVAPLAIGKFLDALSLTTALYCSFEVNVIAIETLQRQQGDTMTFAPVTIALEDGHEVSIAPIALSHRVPSHAFCIHQTIRHDALDTEKLRRMGMPPSKLWGRLQHGLDVTLADGQVLSSSDFVHAHVDSTRLIVAGDNDTPALLQPHLDDVALLVHEATYTQAIADRVNARSDGVNPMHSSAYQVASVAAAANLPNLILTHFSGRFQAFDRPASSIPNMGHIREEVSQVYQGNCWLANDFDCFEVGGLTVTKREPLARL